MPQRIDRYQIESKIADGSSGEIYKAIDLPTGEVVAIKVLAREKLTDRVTVGRFLREARAARDLDHPHIIKIFHVTSWEDTYYLLMEWADGENVLQRIEASGPMPIELVREIGRKIGSALDHAHANAVVHRDVKPANIILLRDGGAKLVDFGFAKRSGDEGGEGLTQTGMAMGTPLYIPPEQVKNAKDVGFASDIYSFGATIYHMLTGRPPFVGKGVGEILQRMMTERLVPPAALREQIPASLSRLVTRMLARKIDDRVSSMKEVVERL